MSLTERSGITLEQVTAELAELEAAYKQRRTAALAVVTEPYQKQRRKLQRLRDVLLEEQSAAEVEED